MKRITQTVCTALLAVTASGFAAAEEPASYNPLAGIQLESLTATREQPVFSRNRQPYRPAQAKAATKPAQMAPVPNLSLVGVVLSDSSPLVILIDQALKTQVHLREGETYNGWTLKRVEPLQAIIQNGATEFRLLLPTAKGS